MAAEGKEDRETRVLEAFCKVSSRARNESWTIADYPDRRRTGSSACDAILLRDTAKVAVEIEIVEAIFGRKEDDARFLEVVQPAEEALRTAFPDFDVTVVVPFHAIPAGVKWSRITLDLSKGLLASIAAKPDDFIGELKLPGIPFEVWVVKHRPWGSPLQNIVRWAPRDQLCDVVQVRLDHAADQLAPYKKAGLETVILLDSDDIALTSPTDFLACVAWSRPSNDVDVIYLVLSQYRPEQVYPLRIGGQVFPEIFPDFARFMNIQSRRSLT